MKLPIHLAYERSICPSEVAFLVVWVHLGDQIAYPYP